MPASTADIYSMLAQLEERQQKLLKKLGDKCRGSNGDTHEEEYSALVQKIFIIKMELLKRKGLRPTE